MQQFVRGHVEQQFVFFFFFFGKYHMQLYVFAYVTFLPHQQKEIPLFFFFFFLIQ
jgi:hypothetical protein